MKVLHLNTNDISGGAARAAYRLHNALNKAGVDSYMLVQKKYTDDPNVIGSKSQLNKYFFSFKSKLDKLPLKIFQPNQPGVWSLNWLPTNINKKIKTIEPDVVNLHWIGNGMVSIKDLANIDSPIVWTMHDMWSFTGGFHYSQDYLNHDGSFISRQIFHSKIKHWSKLNITLVSPSRWLGELAKNSQLFKSKKIKVIPNGIDIQTFKPTTKKEAKKQLNLEQDKEYIMFGAMKSTKNPRKGFQYLIPAIHKLAEIVDKNKVELLVFGSEAPRSPFNFKLKANYLGVIKDDKLLAEVYSAASVTVVPSVIDNLPNVIMESMACGTPVAAFNVGGIPDMIEHKINGYLASPFNTSDLAKGIMWCINNLKLNKRLGEKSRKKVQEEYASSIQAQNYLKLYKKILQSN